MENPQAFPSTELSGQGMSLRDFHESNIMAGFASNMSAKLIKDISEGIRGGKHYLRAASILTDSMLKERSK